MDIETQQTQQQAEPPMPMDVDPSPEETGSDTLPEMEFPPWGP